jgi:hypothetical protein
MKIAIIALPNVDISEAVQKLNPVLVINSSKEPSNFERQFADIALQLDEKILFENIEIDLVFVALAAGNYNYDSILESRSYPHDEAVYYMNGQSKGAFFCKPHVVSVLGSCYKIYYPKYGARPEDRASKTAFFDKILFLINRLGFGFYVPQD